VDVFLRDAQEILDTALAGDAAAAEWAVVVDRQGGIRLLNPVGWSLPALAAEFGARSVFCVRRRAGGVRVEGWSGLRSCVLEQETLPRHGVWYSPQRFPWLNPPRPSADHATL
jgi:hypothetical protein